MESELDLGKQLWERTKRLARRNPAHRETLMGVRKLTPKTTHDTVITVNIPTGKRTVRRVSRQGRPKSIASSDVRAFVRNALEVARLEEIADKRRRDALRLTTPYQILQAVCAASSFSEGELLATYGHKTLTALQCARHLHVFLLSGNRPDLSNAAIGALFPKPRHHSSISQSIRRFPEIRYAIGNWLKHPAILPLLTVADKTAALKARVIKTITDAYTGIAPATNALPRQARYEVLAQMAA